MSLSIVAKNGKKFAACLYVGKLPHLLSKAKEYVGRREFKGYWEEETYFGTRKAVDELDAFM